MLLMIYDVYGRVHVTYVLRCACYLCLMMCMEECDICPYALKYVRKSVTYVTSDL